MELPFNLAIQVARQAGDLLMSFFSPDGLISTRKADHTVVTEADLAADRLISQTIQSHYPQDCILSEESDHILNDDKCAVWVIDPLDGTTNFSLGLHHWGISIARINHGEPEFSVLNFPAIDEFYTSHAGQGAFLNRQRIHTKPLMADQPAAFFSCCSRTHRKYEVVIPYKTRILGSAAYSFCAVARGSAILAFEATPKIWDIVGGWLLLSEAGGVVEAFDGEHPFPLRVAKDYSQFSIPFLAGATEDLIQKARSQIHKRS